MTCASTPMTIAAFPLTSRCWTPGTSLPPIVCSSTKRVSAGSPAGFTNYFRYTLLERSDTIWIDADVLCLSRDWPAQTAVLAAWEDADHINGAVLGLPRQAAFLPGGGGEIRQGHRLGQAGPFLLTRVLAELGITSSVFPPGVFYPIHYSEWYKPFMPEYTGEVNARSKASLAIHLWHSLVRYTNFDKMLLPDEDSFFGQAVLRHATADISSGATDRNIWRT